MDPDIQQQQGSCSALHCSGIPLEQTAEDTLLHLVVFT